MKKTREEVHSALPIQLFSNLGPACGRADDDAGIDDWLMPTPQPSDIVGSTGFSLFRLGGVGVAGSRCRKSG